MKYIVAADITDIIIASRFEESTEYIPLCTKYAAIPITTPAVRGLRIYFTKLIFKGRLRVNTTNVIKKVTSWQAIELIAAP